MNDIIYGVFQKEYTPSGEYEWLLSLHRSPRVASDEVERLNRKHPSTSYYYNTLEIEG